MTAESLVLPYAPASAAVARAAVHNALQRHGVAPLRRDDAALVVSELVANSVRHARARTDGTLLVTWSLGPEELLVEVTDGGGGEPVLRAIAHDAANGRGLAIIDAVARRWGTRYDSDGTTVWATLRVPAGMRGDRLTPIAGARARR